MNGETIIFKSLSGPRLYGTDNENSDMDIKGDKLNNYRKFKDFYERHTNDIDKN